MCERLQAASLSFVLQQQLLGSCSRKGLVFEKKLVRGDRHPPQAPRLCSARSPPPIVCANEGAELIWSAPVGGTQNNTPAAKRSSCVSNAEPSRAISVIQRIARAFRQRGAMSKARVYADVNVQRPKEYWDYEALTVQWG